ncbi:hypothetical protein EV291_1472 [Rhizobium sp. BK068]|nr:hypothetical protein EV291_1472 [Rhizobium sp. BK068]
MSNVEKLKARRLELQFEIDRAERHRKVFDADNLIMLTTSSTNWTLTEGMIKPPSRTCDLRSLLLQWPRVRRTACSAMAGMHGNNHGETRIIRIAALYGDEHRALGRIRGADPGTSVAPPRRPPPATLDNLSGGPRLTQTSRHR